jgi:predicted DNA-binding transcriptional regulator YafY
VRFNFNGNKGFRLLNIYERLIKGETLYKNPLAADFNVSPKTIQRDIDDLRAYFAEAHEFEAETSVRYDRAKSGYYLEKQEREWLTNSEVLAVCKIILESRAFQKDELDAIVSKLLVQTVPADRKRVEGIIAKERACYVPPRHGKRILALIWELSQHIADSELISFRYKRLDGAENTHSVKPVAILFSEFYFYLIAYMADGSKDFPTTFRADRISELKGSKQRFAIPYRDKFNDGEFRKRVCFMYAGELRRVRFKCRRESLEAVLDRLPTAKILEDAGDAYLIEAEAYGTGIDMWLRSQGDGVVLV